MTPFTVWQCPVCDEYVPEHYGPPMMPGRGHFHDHIRDNELPKRAERVFHPAVAVEHFSAEEIRERLLSTEARKAASRVNTTGRVCPSTQAIKAALDHAFPTQQEQPPTTTEEAATAAPDKEQS